MANFLHSESEDAGKGYFPGNIFQVDFYPGAIYDPESTKKVYGEIFRLNDPEKVLTVLDEYEGFGKDFPQPNEFIREIIPVRTSRNVFNCWVYLYNLDVPSKN